jgi:hypothetical protein
MYICICCTPYEVHSNILYEAHPNMPHYSAVPDRAALAPDPTKDSPRYPKTLHAPKWWKIYLTATPHAPRVELTAPAGGVVGAR